MSDQTTLIPERAAPPEGEGQEEFLVSNAMSLSGRQIIGLALFTAAFLLLAPALWKRLEPLPREADYRIPYDLSADYWLFRRLAADAVTRSDTVVLGDSVVWGQYVTREGTLTHHLNHLAGSERFANLGVDGMHPAALAGLIEHHGTDISGKSVVLHCNPLWMSSPRHDLTGEEEFRFNPPG